MSEDNYGLDPDRPTANVAVRHADADGHVDPALEFAGHRPSRRRRGLPAHHRARSASAPPRCWRARARGESQWFTIGDDDALEDAARTVAEVTRERYPSGRHPVPQPLAPLRGRRRRTGSTSSNRLLGDADAARSAPARRSTWRWSACCSMPAPAPTGTTSSRPPASASRAPKGWPSRASMPSPAACSRPTPIGRCRPTPPACARW